MDLNQIDSDSPSLYNLQETSVGYRFETEYGCIYEITFIDYPVINTNPNFKIFTFNIEPIYFEKRKGGLYIKATIQKVLLDFFKKNTNALIVILDNSDQKHHARHRLFNLWYIDFSEKVERIEADMIIEENEIIASLFVERNNPYIEEIRTTFKDLQDIGFWNCWGE